MVYYKDISNSGIISKYNRSEIGITEVGHEFALTNLGREAIEYIIEYIKDNKMNRDKSDLLMVIVSEIMVNYSNGNKYINEKDRKVVEEIERYYATMKNQGVFDREDRVRCNLNRIKTMILSNSPPGGE
jgi:hypothetical protein